MATSRWSIAHQFAFTSMPPTPKKTDPVAWVVRAAARALSSTAIVTSWSASSIASSTSARSQPAMTNETTTSSPKEAITIRLDADVLAWFKEHIEGGRSYQSEINRVLRRHVASKEKRRA